jgi:hypothetical protein
VDYLTDISTSDFSFFIFCGLAVNFVANSGEIKSKGNQKKNPKSKKSSRNEQIKIQDKSQDSSALNNAEKKEVKVNGSFFFVENNLEGLKDTIVEVEAFENITISRTMAMSVSQKRK